MLEIAILTIGVFICVLFFGSFLLMMRMSKQWERKYVNHASPSSAAVMNGTSFTSKISNWYLTKGALPHWCIVLADSFILLYCQLMAAYLVRGGQVLVPLFWQYIILAFCSLPFYYLGMRLFRSYESMIRFSRMEDLARIVCALFIGTVSVDVIKHFIPMEVLPVYPIWQEQLIMLICAVFLMWSVRILVKSLYDSSDRSNAWVRVFVYGTSIPSIDCGLSVRKDQSKKGLLVAFVRANEKEPNITIQGAALVNPHENVCELMKTTNANMLMVPLLAYPDFFEKQKALVDELLANDIKVLVSK